MKTTLQTILPITLILIGLLIDGCKKREDLSFEASTSNSEAFSVFDDVSNVIDEAASEQPDLNKLEVGSWALQTASCASVTLEPLGADFPKTLTIDFGGGCQGIDGRHRSGQIICEFTGLYRNEGTVTTVDLQNYELDNYQVEGHKVITNQGDNSDGNPYFTIEVTGASVTSQEGTATWSSDRIRTWTEGSNTNWFTTDTTQPLGIMGLNGILDDIYQVEGTAEGTTRQGVPYTIVITSPLEVQVGCRWIKAGTLVISPQNLNDRTIDYGTGTCDNSATVEVNGDTYGFTMW